MMAIPFGGDDVSLLMLALLAQRHRALTGGAAKRFDRP